MRYLTTSASLAAVFLAAAACGDDSGSLADPAECAGTPEVSVNDAGAKPRRAMELSPTVGDSMALDMRMEMGIEASVDGETAPTQDVPPMHLGMLMTVEDVSEDEIEMSFVYDQARVEGGDPTLQDALSSIVDSSGTVVTTRKGVFVDGDFEAAPGLDPALAATTDQLERQMADLTIPFPDEPVGPGAEWEVASSVELNGLSFCNFYTYRLVEFDGDSYEMEADMEQKPAGGTTETQGATIELVDGSGNASGTYSGSLSRPIAVSGSVEATSDMEMSVSQGGDEMTQEVGTTIEVEISPRS